MSNSLNGITFEKAVEARAKIDILPNLHILIGKNSDNKYIGLCLDSGIICDTNFNKLDSSTVDYIFKDLCLTAIAQFNYFYRNNKELLLTGKVDREYWDIYDKLILEVKQKSLCSFFEAFSPAKNEEIIEKVNFSEPYKNSQQFVGIFKVIFSMNLGAILSMKTEAVESFYSLEAII